jgi:hypothetical protein
MTTIELLGGLKPYTALLATLCDFVKQRNPGQQYNGTVSLSYDTITVKLARLLALENDRRSFSGELQCSFEIREQIVFCSGLYCQIKDDQNEIEDLIRLHTPATGRPWNPVAQDVVYSPAVSAYLAIADSIAGEGYMCSSGDHYRPGYFSELVISDNEIELKQINHWNARSLNHKNDYHLRDLVLVIPLTPGQERSAGHDYTIGEMTVNFSDRSSVNNRQCGDKIQDRINSAILKFN